MKTFKKIPLILENDHRGIAHPGLSLIVLSILIFAVIGGLHSKSNHVSGDILDIKSGISGQCLDDHDSSTKPDSEVDDHSCNDTVAQAWSFSGVSIKNGNLCLSVDSNSHTAGAAVLLDSCTSDPGQVWLSDNGKLYNPNSQLCLSEPDSSGGKQVVVAGCNNSPTEAWTTPDAALNCSSISLKGQRIACYAEKEWETWQTGTPSHESLLNTYTDGAAYEEWCADFVSYVYKQAGYPFTGGEADGWDESNANLVQNMGFTMHSATNYTPQPGDVAFFNYTGGHVEIVISGGKHPSFIYGNSARVDPTTGNGEMESNSIIRDGSLGNLTYYLSPN
jgi:hypothetical protein